MCFATTSPMFEMQWIFKCVWLANQSIKSRWMIRKNKETEFSFMRTMNDERRPLFYSVYILEWIPMTFRILPAKINKFDLNPLVFVDLQPPINLFYDFVQWIHNSSALNFALFCQFKKTQFIETRHSLINEFLLILHSKLKMSRREHIRNGRQKSERNKMYR